ncbi:MAG: tetratricopeptide repeat protein [Planctomycetes bacterium]|nr:tetratricopeptide repeat protein [Planctomycetota bacterium]
MTHRIRSVLCLLILAVPVASLRAADEPQTPDAPSVFDLPSLQVQQAASVRAFAALLARGEYAQAEQVLRKSIERVPHNASSHYNLACVLARQGRNDEALAALEKSVELGFRDARHMEADEDLKSLRENDRFKDILDKASKPLEVKPEGWHYQVTPAEIQDGQVLVGEGNTAWNAKLGVFHAFFKLDREATADKAIAAGLGKAGDLLRTWDAEGTAAGNHGDLYDNHDSDHSNMNFKALPQLTRIEFSEEARKRNLHHGLQLSFLYNGVTIGNSSTALTSGAFWRSQPRLALTRPRGAGLLYLQYVGNHMYFYPEHRDHDPQVDGKGHGDVFAANTPYMIISQGSSGSDRAFMNAVAATLAAFRPEVKQKLAKSGTLMAAVQMIFRSSNKMVETPEDYLTGKAHPTVFDGAQIQVEKMVTLAHDMTLESLPPMVQIKVIEEDQPIVGRDYFDVAPRERMFDTPCAIARVVKSTKHDRRMVVSAEGSKDLDGKPLTYHWVVLRGDADRIRINKLDDTGSRIELIVPYHRRSPIAPGSKMESNRVDIGVFVHNGQYYSAPGFVCLYYLANEKRVYDDRHCIQVVDYTDPAVKGVYVDPLLDFPKNWRDEYQYAEDGSRLGWTRTRGEQRQEFTADGELIQEKDAAGKPTKTTPVHYIAKPGKGGAATLEQVAGPTTAQPRQD